MKAGWKPKKLGEVLRLEYGKPLAAHDRDKQGKYLAFGANGALCRTNRYFHDKPSVIIGRKGSAGEVNLTPEKFWPLDVTYFVTFDDAQYDLMFLFHVLRFLRLPSLAKGVKPGINRNDVYDLIFSFPSLPEQRRIVSILDEAFAGLDAMRANAEKNLQNARDLSASYSDSVFSEQTSWTEANLDEVVAADCSLSYGIVQPGNEVPDGLPIVRPTDLVSRTIELDGLKRINPALAASYQRTMLQAGDLLLCVRGTTGTVAVASKSLTGANVTRGIVPIRFDPKKVLADFGYHLLRCDYVQTQIRAKTYGAALMQINIKDLREVRVRFPKLSEQKSISKRLDAADQHSNELLEIYSAKLAAIDELKQSILQKAFAGELTSAEAVAA